MVMAWASLKMNNWGRHRLYPEPDVSPRARVPGQQVSSSTRSISHAGEGPAHSTFLAIYFTLTGLHGLHILGGMVVMAYFLGPGAKMWKTEPEQFTNRIDTRACIGTSSISCGFSCSRCYICCRQV